MKRIRCKMFGHFDVFIDGKPVRFRLNKTKELLALCVAKQGGTVSNEEILEKLWEFYDGKVRDFSTLRIVIKELKDVLTDFGLEEVFRKERDCVYINKDMIECDYFDFMEGDEYAMCDFQGEFLSGYSWGEGYLYALCERKVVWKSRALGLQSCS